MTATPPKESETVIGLPVPVLFELKVKPMEGVDPYVLD